MPPRGSRAPGGRPRSRCTSAPSTRTSWPTACCTIGTRPRWSRSWAPRCSSRRISPPWSAGSWPPVTPAPLPGPAPLSTADVMDALHAAYDDEPFVVVTDAPPSTKATAGSNCAHVTARVDERTGWVLVAVRPRQSGQGGLGPGRPVRQRRPRPPRDDRAARSRGCTRERHRARRASSAAGGSAGIKAGGVPDVAVVATDDGRAVPAAGVFTAESRRGGPGAGQPGPPRRATAGGPPG